ncbi:MAG TPA: NAD-dependent epimerase/dehydratase family protein [Acidobacteriota bacterium]|nr:NAD-dependent epimerase/dehydratase family protein [Acidobacteriota bacterium]
MTLKILVTGGAGFIGSHVVDAFLSAGHAVSVVDDLSTGFRHNLAPGVPLHVVDIRDPKLSDVFEAEKPEVVCHQAARANVRESFEKPLLYADVNVLGSLNILECCRRVNVRKVIYACTGGAVYGPPEELPVTEQHPINPLDPYGASKHHVEHYLHLYEKNYGVSYTSLRYPNVYGPRQNPFGEAGVVAIFARQMLDNKRPVINGSGKQERDFVSVTDIARANLLSLNKGDGEIMNIGSGLATSINMIFSALAGLTGYKEKAEYGPAKAGEVYRIFLNADRAKSIIGWTPKVGLVEGLAATVEYFRKSTSV